MNLIYRKETYQIIGRCMEVYNQLGTGFSEVIYKDALEYEFKNLGIFYERGKEYEVIYKNLILPHRFYADFVVFGEIILEIKGVKKISNEHIAQTINYLKASNNKLGLLVNFGEESLNFQRIVR